jgi:hypothetical protein
MRKLFVAGVIAALLAASTAFALDGAKQPVKGTEGPDIRRSQDVQSTQPVKGTEGPDVRKAGRLHSDAPVVGPDIR